MSKCEEGKSKRKPLLLQAGSASLEDSGDHLLQAGWQTMQTGFILAIRAIKAIGAIMTTLEIMLTRASPLVMEIVVDELEWTMLLAI